MLNDRTGKRIKYNRGMKGDCSIFRHMYGGNKRNRNNSHKYTVDEINKDAHAAIDNIMKKDCEYHRKIDEALITAMTMGNLHK